MTTEDVAQELLARKLSGRRINLAVQDREVQQRYTELINLPESQRAYRSIAFGKSFGTPTQSKATTQDLNPYQSVAPPVQTQAPTQDTPRFTPRPQTQTQATPQDLRPVQQVQQSLLPTSREQAIQQSLPPQQRNQPPQTVTERIVGTRASQMVDGNEGGGGSYRLVEKQVDTFRPKGTRQDIPVTKVYVVDAQGNIVRQANSEEGRQFRSGTNVLRATTSQQLQTERQGMAFFEGQLFDIGSKRGELKTSSLRGTSSVSSSVLAFGLGVASVGVGTLYSIRHPVLTVSEIGSYVKDASKDPSVIRTTGAKIGETIKIEPEFSTGVAVGVYAVGKAPKGIVKVIDQVRIKGLTNIPADSVIAPEFEAGQRYPAIKKGQTAGQLLQEFEQPRQYGVTKLSGFTASPTQFAPKTIAQIGTSELPGVYQAPKVSPAFLRIAIEESKAFSLNPFETMRPSIIKILPTKYELSRGVSFKQRSLASLSSAKLFFQKGAKQGKSYIPFVKTEKEAIIPAGTKLSLTQKRFYTEFEGRKIPIFEFEASEGIASPTKRITTAGKISDYAYQRRVGARASVTSADLLSLKSYSVRSSYKPSKVSSSIQSSSKSISSSGSITSSSKSIPSSSKSISSSLSVSRLSSSLPSKSYGGRSYSGGSSSRGYVPSSINIVGKGFSYPKKYSGKSGQNIGNFIVLQRRYGKFKTIGTAGSIEQAYSIGELKTRRNLGATFKVRSLSGGSIKTVVPKGFYAKQSKKEGIVIIQKRKGRLSSQTEKLEIIQARQSKRRRK